MAVVDKTNNEDITMLNFILNQKIGINNVSAIKRKHLQYITYQAVIKLPISAIISQKIVVSLHNNNTKAQSNDR